MDFYLQSSSFNHNLLSSWLNSSQCKQLGFEDHWRFISVKLHTIEFLFSPFHINCKQNVLKLDYFLIYKNVITKINPVFRIPVFIPSQNIQLSTLKLVNQAKGHTDYMAAQSSEHITSNMSKNVLQNNCMQYITEKLSKQ